MRRSTVPAAKKTNAAATSALDQERQAKRKSVIRQEPETGSLVQAAADGQDVAPLAAQATLDQIQEIQIRAGQRGSCSCLPREARLMWVAASVYPRQTSSAQLGYFLARLRIEGGR
jgi:hypothetical protein